MEDLKVGEEHYGYGCKMNLGGKEFHIRRALPREEKNRMALDLAQAALVFDEELGIVYEGYTYEAVLVMCMMRYYTDLDVSEYEDENGWNTLCDILESNALLDNLYDMLSYDLDTVLGIYEKIKTAATRTFEHKHSLGYRAGRAFGSILTDEDITATLAKAEGVNSTMIDLLGAFTQIRGPKQMMDNGVIQFSKRQP